MLALAQPGQLAHVALQDKFHVVIEPAVAGRWATPRQGNRHAPGRYARDVLLSARCGDSPAGSRARRIVKERCQEILSHAVDLALGERPHGQQVQAPRERLRGDRQRVVAGGSSDHVPASSQLAVQLGLDGVQHRRYVLVLIDAHRRRTDSERAGVGQHRRARGRLVEVHHFHPARARQLAQHGRLANSARSLQRDHRLICEAFARHLQEPPCDDPRDRRESFAHELTVASSPRFRGV